MWLCHHFSMTPREVDALSPEQTNALVTAGSKVLDAGRKERRVIVEALMKTIAGRPVL